MPIDLSAPPLPISFEVYPPRSESGFPALHETIRRLAAVEPRFISVTYGAGGSTGGRSLELLSYILRETRIEPLAHLTCVGSSWSGAAALIREFVDAGITSFLALRGDTPADAAESDAPLGDFETAAELVQLISRVRAEHVPYTEGATPGVPGAARIEERPAADIAVAAFPTGHPRSAYAMADIDALLAKQAAGATFAITQLFFHSDDYLGFVDRARTAGVTIPVLPGIMPIVSPARLRRVLELTGEGLPRDLSDALEGEPTPEGRRELGIAHAAQLAREVVTGGAPGVHLYAFNNHDTVLAVLREADLLTASPRNGTTR